MKTRQEKSESVHVAQSGDAYRSKNRWGLLVLLSLATVLLAFSFLQLRQGTIMLGARELLSALLSGPPRDGTSSGASFAGAVVWELRLPRICFAMLGGAALGLSGALMQGILRNPLASPFTLGISGAASFGAALAITLAPASKICGQWHVIASAFLFTVLSSGLILLLSDWRGMGRETIILVGVALSYLFSAMTSILQYLGSAEQVQTVVFWMLGSLEGIGWTKVFSSAPFVALAIPFMLLMAWDLNAMACGDEVAQSLGVRPSRLRAAGIFLASLATACVICFIGTIGFVGLVSPHIARMLVGPDHRFQLPASMLAGGLVLLAADFCARRIAHPHVIPLGIMTSCVGVPFFIYLILRRRREV